MDKRAYERLELLKTKVADGTATFKEHNILKMEEKRARKKNAHAQNHQR